MRSHLVKFLLCFFVLATLRIEAQTNPHTQIRWPTNCNTANMVYTDSANTCINAVVGPQIDPSQIINWPSNCNIAGAVYNFASNSCFVSVVGPKVDPSAEISWPGSCTTATQVYNLTLNACVDLAAQTFTAGSTTTLPPGSNATVTVTGSYPHYGFNFGIPAGVQGGSTSYPGVLTDGNNGLQIAGNVQSNSRSPNAVTVATLPAAPAVGTIVLVTDSQGNCSLGGGSQKVDCRWNGTSWDGLGSSVNLLNTGQSPVYSINGPVAGFPTASRITPDALQQQGPEYASQSGVISSVTDANAKTALTATNTALLSLQNALEQAGIYFPNSLSQVISSTTGAVFILFNATGAALPPLSVSNVLTAADTWTAVPAAGYPNFVSGGKGEMQGGWVKQGRCGTGPNLTPSGPVLSSVPGTVTMSNCVATITNSSQVQGGGSLTQIVYPAYADTVASHLTIAAAGGVSICWWGSSDPEVNPSNSSVGPVYNFAVSKAAEWSIGPGYGAVSSTTANQPFTFPTTTTANAAFWFGTNGVNHYVQPQAAYQMCVVFNPSVGSFGAFTVYMNDGSSPLFTSGQILMNGAVGTSIYAPGLLNTGWMDEALLYLPGTQLTQAQVSGLYHGFTTAAPANPYAISPNRGPTFTSSPAVQWNVHTLVASDLQDCSYFNLLNNGGNSAGVIGNQPYHATYSQCHTKFTSSAPVVRVGLRSGIPSSVGSVTLRIDGVVAETETLQTGSNIWYITGIPSTTNVSHTYDVNIGLVGGNVGIGYSTPQVYSGFSGAFLDTVSVPNPYSMSFISESGTVALCVTDSILCTGFNALLGNAASLDSTGSFLPIERYSTGTTSFNTANIAGLGVGGMLLSNDFNTAGAISGTVPTAEATTWVNNNLPVLTGGTPANAAVNIVARGINDVTHGKGVFGNSANCTAIFAFALKNELAAMAAYNSSIKHYVFSPLNIGSYAGEPTADGCASNSYTVINNISAYEYSGGVWTSTPIGAGTVLSGTAAVWVYRAIEADVCASTTNCTYVELGPGAVANSDGTLPPTLSTTANQCYATSQQCFGNDNLHPTAYGHFVLARYINSLPWATPQVLKQFP
jgi:hypothetical protein